MRRCWWIRRTRWPSPPRCGACLTDPGLRAELGRGAWRVRGSSRGNRRPNEIRDIYQDVAARDRIALVHDWLTGMRGGEKALEVLCELYPTPTCSRWSTSPAACRPRIDTARIRTSLLQRLPGRPVYRHYLPLFPFAIEQFDLDDVDLVVSTSHCAAKAVVPRPGARHLCYCFTPMRYAWDQFDHYFGPDRVGHGRHARWRDRFWRAGPLGRRDGAAALTAMWLFHIMLRAESADTIIASRTSCTRPWTPSSSSRMDGSRKATC